MRNWKATTWEPYGSRNDDLVMLYSLHDEDGGIIVIDSLLNLDIRGKEND